MCRQRRGKSLASPNFLKGFFFLSLYQIVYSIAFILYFGVLAARHVGS